MSKQRDTIHKTVKFTEATMSSKLYVCMPDDDDFNGNNGEEYLSEQAKKKKFDSDKDYAYWQAARKSAKLSGEKKVKKFINTIVSAMKKSGGDFYEKIEYDLTRVGTTYIVSFLIQTAW